MQAPKCTFNKEDGWKKFYPTISIVLPLSDNLLRPDISISLI